MGDLMLVSRASLEALVDAAGDFATDLESGLADGTYEDGAPLAPVVKALAEGRTALAGGPLSTPSPTSADVQALETQLGGRLTLDCAAWWERTFESPPIVVVLMGGEIAVDALARWEAHAKAPLIEKVDADEAPPEDFDSAEETGWGDFWAGLTLAADPGNSGWVRGWHAAWARAYALGWSGWAVDDLDNPYPQFSGAWEAWGQGWNDRSQREESRNAAR